MAEKNYYIDASNMDFETACGHARNTIAEAMKILQLEPASMLYLSICEMVPINDKEVTVRLATVNAGGQIQLQWNPYFICRLNDPSELAFIFFGESLRIALHHATHRRGLPAAPHKFASDLICYENQKILSKWRKEVKEILQNLPSYAQIAPKIEPMGFDKRSMWQLEKIRDYLRKVQEQQQKEQQKQGGQSQQQQQGKNGQQSQIQKLMQGGQRQQQNGQGQQQNGQGQGQQQNQNGQGQQQQGQGNGQQQQGNGQGQQQQGQGQQGQGQGQQGQGQGQNGQGQGQGQNGQGQGQQGQGQGQGNGNGQGQQGQGQGQGQGGGQSGSGDDGSSSGDQGANQGDRSDPSHGSNGMDSSANAGDLRGENAPQNGSNDTGNALNEHFSADERHARKATQEWGENTLVEQEIRSITKHLGANPELWGSMPGELQEMIRRANTPKFDPTPIIKHWKQTIQSEEMYDTRSKANRRHGFDRPGWRHKMKSSMVECVDASGSMSDRDVAIGESFVNLFIKHCETWFCYWDAACGPIEPVKKKRKGDLNLENMRGGTDPRCIIDRIEKERLNFGGILVFTDNGFDWPRPKTKYLNKIFIIGTENCCEPPSWCRHYLNIRDIKKWMKDQNFLEG